MRSLLVLCLQSVLEAVLATPRPTPAGATSKASTQARLITLPSPLKRPPLTHTLNPPPATGAAAGGHASTQARTARQRQDMWEGLKGAVYQTELTQVALRGDVDLLRQKLASVEKHHKEMLTCPAGKHRLRYLASAAAYEGKREIVEYLVKERGVAINAIDEDPAGWNFDKDMTPIKNASLTPLVAAIAGKHDDLAVSLLAMAKSSGEGGEAELLNLERRFPPDSGSLAHYAAANGQTRVLGALIERDPVLTGLSDGEGHTPLCRAVEHGHHHVISIIFAHYTSKERLQEVCTSPCTSNSSVLRHAINGILNGAAPEKEEELVDLLRMLMGEWGQEVEEEIFSIRLERMPSLHLTILHLAAIQEWSNVIELMVNELEVNIDILIPSTEHTPLHCACMSTLLKRPTALEFITWLVEDLGADVLLKDTAGLTASQHAGKRGGLFAREVRDYLRRKEEEMIAPTAEEEEEEAFLLEGAPAEYKDVFSMGLMQSSPVTASDGYVYERQSLERWIRTCREEGKELTSPRTGAGMAALFLPNLTHRTLVRDWVEKRKAEWGKRKTEEAMDEEDQEEEGGVLKKAKQQETSN